MTKEEWLIAIINGAKGTSNHTKNTKYIQYINGIFRYANEYAVDLSKHTADFALYEEPKKMVKVAKYRYFTYHWEDTPEFFKSGTDFLDIYVTASSKFTRLIETEIEVEDY